MVQLNSYLKRANKIHRNRHWHNETSSGGFSCLAFRLDGAQIFLVDDDLVFSELLKGSYAMRWPLTTCWRLLGAASCGLWVFASSPPVHHRGVEGVAGLAAAPVGGVRA